MTKNEPMIMRLTK